MGALCDVLSHLDPNDMAMHDDNDDDAHHENPATTSAAISANPDEQPQNHTSTTRRRGSIYYQTAHITKEQLQNVITQSRGDFDKAPRFLFGDNDIQLCPPLYESVKKVKSFK